MDGSNYDRSTRRVVLVQQGGGALGAYQAGAYEALSAYGHAPDWIAGVSIGAINGALIAGNAPSRRVERLRTFWERITAPLAPLPSSDLPGWRAAERSLGAAHAWLFGQPGFYRPRLPFDWAGGRASLSLYDASELRRTLESLVDFDRISAYGQPGIPRLSVGAVEVATGNLVYFDSARKRIGPEHILASAALPPSFAPVEVDGHAYWDGGLVSNTPLQYVLNERPRRSSLIFQVDLFSASGPMPASLDDVLERDKDIRHSSRTRTGTNDAEAQQNLCRQLREFLLRLPEELRADPVALHLQEYASAAQIDVANVIYRPAEPQGSQKDYQFDRATMERRWEEGRADAIATLEAAPWEVPPEPDVGFRTFDVLNPDPARRSRARFADTGLRAA